LQEASLLRLTQRFNSLSEVTDAYGANVGASVGALSDFWHKVVSPQYDPKVEYELERANKKAPAELWTDTDKKLGELSKARRDLTDKMVHAFME